MRIFPVCGCYLTRAFAASQAEPVLPVKDATSDMPTIARKGSSLVKEYRQKRDENKSRERFWEVAGSKMGDIIGVDKAKDAEGKPPDPEDAGDDGEVDYKADSRCAHTRSRRGV